MFGGNLHEKTNYTWGISFVLALLILAGVTFLFRSQFAGLIKGKDQRTSTSKTQALLWTYAVTFALLTLLAANAIVEAAHAISPHTDYLKLPAKGERTLAGNVAVPFTEFVNSGLDATYFFLLGLPFGGAIAAKAITSTKVANGTVVKPPKDEAPDDTKKGAVAEVVVDDEGDADVGDFQYFLLNLVALGFFLSQFLIHPAKGLPEMPDTLVAITSVSAAAYVTKKGLYRDPPVLLSVDPPAAAPGELVHIYGTKLLGSPVDEQTAERANAQATNENEEERKNAQALLAKAGGSVTVLFGRAVARPLRPGVDEVTDGDEVMLTSEHLVVAVPERLDAGPTTVSVKRPPGAESERLPFEVTGAKPVIHSVVPNTVKRSVATALTITGRDFTGGGAAGESNAVTLGGVRLDLVSSGEWNDGYVKVEVPVDAVDEGSQSLIVYDRRGRPSDPEPVIVTA